MNIRPKSVICFALGTFAVLFLPCPDLGWSVISNSIFTTLDCAPRISASTKKRIVRVERGLIGPVRIAGETNAAMSLPDRMAHCKIPGVSIAVLDSGILVWAKGYGQTGLVDGSSVDTNTIFQAASISKPVTAIAFLRLVDRGTVDLDSDIRERPRSWHIPSLVNGSASPITLRATLSHTAGFSVHGFSGYSRSTPLPSTEQILNGRPPANNQPVMLSFPAGQWHYSGGGYIVDQQLLEDATRQSFASAVEDLVLRPAGMVHSGFWQPLPARLQGHAARGYDSEGREIEGHWMVFPELAAAGLWTTPSDLVALMSKLIYQNGAAGRPGLLSSKSLDEMLTPVAGGYGLGWYVAGVGEEVRISHGGSNPGFESLIVYYPYLGRGAAVRTNGELGSDLTSEIMRSIALEYRWPDYVPPVRNIVSVSPAILKNYAGRYEYEAATAFIFVLTEASGRLYVEAPNMPRFELLPLSERRFIMRNGWEIEFELGGDSKVTSMLFNNGMRAKRIASP